MDLKTLLYFTSAAETLNFSKTAEQFGISQTAVSLAISKLETEIAFPLFDRRSRPMSLTEAGEFFYIRSKKLLKNYSFSVKCGKEIDEGFSGALKVIVPSIFEGLVVMESFRQYQQEKPGLDITLSKTAANRITNSIDRGKADAAICCSEVFVNSLDIISKNFLKFTYVVALRANHPLASLPSIPPEKLMGMGCVTLQDTSTASEQHIQDFTSTINLKFKSKIRTSNIEDFFFELGLNAYYGLIPDYFVPYINTGFICRSIADTNLPQYHLALCYKKENHNSALQWLHYSLLRN